MTNKPKQFGESLLEGLDAPPPPKRKKRGPVIYAPRLGDFVMRHGRSFGIGGGSLAALALLVWGILWWYVPAPPDPLDDSMMEVGEFILLSDRFNELPIQERIDMLADVAERFRNPTTEDAGELAALAASIRRDTREQLEENAAELVKDVFDQFAADYDDIPVDDRALYMDNALVEMSKLIDRFDPDADERDDNERLAEMRKENDRNDNWRRRSDGPERINRIRRLLRDDIMTQTNVAERGRLIRFMGDMTRHLRGEDISKPAGD
jgi:hypothetical protein